MFKHWEFWFAIIGAIVTGYTMFSSQEATMSRRFDRIQKTLAVQQTTLAVTQTDLKYIREDMKEIKESLQKPELSGMMP